MKLIIENWRRFIKEDFRKGNIGSEFSQEKEELKKKFSSAFAGAQEESANQFLETMLGKKPMYYGIVNFDGIKINDKKLLDAIRAQGFAIKTTPHTERAKKDVKAYYFGKPENVRAAVELSKNPLVGKEKYGFEECLRVRETHNDETFIKSYLDEDLCKELNLFSYSFSRKEGYNKITDVSNENTWRTVRDDLITNIGLNSVPVILVEELKKDGTLILRHEHDGRDLELSEANKVFEHINDLWPGGVRFTTIIEEEDWEF